LSTVERVLLLTEAPVFAGARTEDLALVAAACREIRAPRGEVIYKAGDPSHAMHVVVQGRVLLEWKDRGRFAIEAGKAFGTWALFGGSPRLFTATSDADTHMLTLDRDPFYDIVADHVTLARALIETLATHVREAILARRDPTEIIDAMGLL
jgi:CRP-like cAMP-binding protein